MTSDISEQVSYILGVVSIIFYSIVYFPQLHLISKTKNSDDLSIMMFILWNQADVLSLIGIIILQLELTLIIIGWYHLIIGVIMMFVAYYYKSKRTVKDTVAVVLFMCVNLTVTIVLQALIVEPYEKIGESMGWITAVVYIVGRFPQLYLNYKSKSTESVSIGMYAYTILGSVFYVGSIYAFSSEVEYLRANLPWIAMSLITIFFDIVIIAQCVYYRRILRKSKNDDVEITIDLDTHSDIQMETTVGFY
jgi:solute carrier family 66 (lysosomal lysine-arginine transporter), member 1